MPPADAVALSHQRKFGRFTVFLFESPRSSELGSADREIELLRAACELSGHRFAGFAPVNAAALAKTLNYIFATWKSPQ